jgi:peptidoglycan hydrolase-like protein with peptidoglycan-binding domain
MAATTGACGLNTAWLIESGSLLRVVDGQFGPATCAALQRALNSKTKAGLDVDGAFGPLTIKDLQSYLDVAADGTIGPGTVTALNKHLGLTPDGTWDTGTTNQLQKPSTRASSEPPGRGPGGLVIPTCRACQHRWGRAVTTHTHQGGLTLSGGHADTGSA